MAIRTVLAGLLLGALALPALAQGVAGQWSATMDGAQGGMQIQFNFVVDGAELTGSMSSEFMGEVPITDGRIDGNSISFSINVPGGPGGGVASMSIAGEIDGDDLTLAPTEGAAGGGAQPLVFKRVEQQGEA